MQQMAFLIFSLLYFPFSVLSLPKPDPDNLFIHLHSNKSTGGEVRVGRIVYKWIILSYNCRTLFAFGNFPPWQFSIHHSAARWVWTSTLLNLKCHQSPPSQQQVIGSYKIYWNILSSLVNLSTISHLGLSWNAQASTQPPQTPPPPTHPTLIE